MCMHVSSMHVGMCASRLCEYVYAQCVCKIVCLYSMCAFYVHCVCASCVCIIVCVHAMIALTKREEEGVLLELLQLLPGRLGTRRDHPRHRCQQHLHLCGVKIECLHQLELVCAEEVAGVQDFVGRQLLLQRRRKGLDSIQLSRRHRNCGRTLTLVKF